MTKGQRNANTPAGYIEQLEEPRRTDIAQLDTLIKKAVPKLAPVIQGSMLGYGPCHYKYASGREGDTCRVTLASNKSYISIYIFAADDQGWVAERYKDDLPKASIGKSCVRFKRLADVDQKVLTKLLKEAEEVGFKSQE